MTGESSVKDLKSRFEQFHVAPKPVLAPKPSGTPRQNDNERPMPRTKPKSPNTTVGELSKLVRSETNDSQASDPFGSPLNSPAAEAGNKKPPLPGNKPRYMTEERRSGACTVTSLPRSAVPIVISDGSSASPRPSSVKVPPPPPSPRIRSPRPASRTSLVKPGRHVSGDIFGDHQSSETEDERSSSPEDVFTISRSLDTHISSQRQTPASPSSRPHSPHSLYEKPSSPDSRSSTSISHSRPTSPRKTGEKFEHYLTVPKTGLTDDILSPKPLLPIRPQAINLSKSNITPIVEVASPTLEQGKPALPRRTDTIQSIPPSSLSGTPGFIPPLPARTGTKESSTSSRSSSRQSLQHERKSLEAPASFRRSLDDFKTPASLRAKPNSRDTSDPINDDSEGDEESTLSSENARSADQPDASTANRKAPRFRGTRWDITTGKEVRRTALCGDLMMIAHTDKLKLHNLLTAEVTWQLPIVDTRVTAMDFRTVSERQLENAGRYLWVGYKDGSLHELDLRNRAIVERYFHAHSGAVVAILRNRQAMWTLDELGNLHIWSTGEAISLKGRPTFRSLKTVMGASATVVVRGQLWIGSGRNVHIFDPSSSNNTRLTPERGLEPGRITGLITCAVHLFHAPEVVYFGHDDGKISIYSIADLKCLEVISISHYNLSALISVGDYLWASFKTGKVFIYDVHQRPWRVMKEWHAHKSPLLELNVDRYGLWKEKRLQVSSMAADGAIKIWDGLMMEDWLDAEMQRRLKEFSTFRAVSTLVCTWNAGASLPHKLTAAYEDAQFIENMIRQADSPDIIVFGFQELVDLDDKGKAGRSVAKGFFGKKKEKEPDERQRAVAYQQWQNYLEKQVSIASSSSDSYVLLQVRDLVGLFTCLFVKQKLMKRIGHISASSVKTGLKGRYGNKGGIVIRFTLDDTSMCFVNCHLAAGQKHVMARNNDVFSILDQAGLQAADEQQTKNNVFVCGGDGSMVLDHEICVLNGDLNYRINGRRSQILQNIQEGKLTKLLESDQLLVELKKNPTHRLRSFMESPIRFNPTYKYDPGTDNYDSSEKLRIPAWCDRIYYRGLGFSEIEVQKYQTHICRVSDHRPVSAILHMQVKTVDQEHRQVIYESVSKQWVDLANKTIVARKIAVLEEATGKGERECREALRHAHGQAVSDAALALLQA